MTAIAARVVGPLNPLGRGRRLPNGESAGTNVPEFGVNLSPAFALCQRDEAAGGNRRRAVVLVKRATGDEGDLEVGSRAVVAPGVITRPEVDCLLSVVVAPVTFAPASVTAIVALSVAPLNPPAAAVDDS